MGQDVNRCGRNADAPACLVFGGSGTLGRVVCTRLHEAGARVAFTYHRGQNVAEELCARNPGMHAHALDLSSSEDVGRVVREVASRWGRLDAFVHCAAIGIEKNEDGPLEEFPSMGEIDVADWDRVMAVNTRSVYLAGQAVFESMRESGGNVVLLGSIDGVKPVPAPIHYAASKGALQAMARTMAKEFADYNIRVNLVAPGIMEGGLSRTIPNHHRSEYLKHTSLSRLGIPDEIASLVVWFALENTYVNGECIVVDGGL